MPRRRRAMVSITRANSRWIAANVAMPRRSRRAPGRPAHGMDLAVAEPDRLHQIVGWPRRGAASGAALVLGRGAVGRAAGPGRCARPGVPGLCWYSSPRRVRRAWAALDRPARQPVRGEGQELRVQHLDEQAARSSGSPPARRRRQSWSMTSGAAVGRKEHRRAASRSGHSRVVLSRPLPAQPVQPPPRSASSRSKPSSVGA